MNINDSTIITAGRETGRGAGALIYCPPTGRFLLVKRSKYGDEPNTWCGLGGGVEADETDEEATRREIWEEAGFDGDMKLIHMNEHTPNPEFTFHNYFGIVDREFEPELNHEHTDYQWVTEWPTEMHPGLMESINEYTAQHDSI